MLLVCGRAGKVTDDNEPEPKATRIIDAAIDVGADRFSRVERAKLREMLAEWERSKEQWERSKKMLVSYERSEWLWGKMISWAKAAFACAAAAVAVKTLFGGFLADFMQALQVVWRSKP